MMPAEWINISAFLLLAGLAHIRPLSPNARSRALLDWGYRHARSLRGGICRASSAFGGNVCASRLAAGAINVVCVLAGGRIRYDPARVFSAKPTSVGREISPRLAGEPTAKANAGDLPRICVPALLCAHPARRRRALFGAPA